MPNHQSEPPNYIHFHTGYYKKSGKTYDEMSKSLGQETNNEYFDGKGVISDLPNPYEDASIFLQGSCELFALALHQEFGFKVYTIPTGMSFHCFCKSNYNGTEVYIDVRGATTDFKEFISGVYLARESYDCHDFTLRDIEDDAKLSNPYDTEGLAFAKHLIHEHPEYYNVGNP